MRDSEGAPLTVVRREPELRVEATKKGARIVLHPFDFDESGTSVVREGDELVIVSRTPAAARLSEVLGEQGLAVPKEGLGRLHQVVAALSATMPVVASNILAREESEGDPRPHVQLFRLGSGLRARLRVTFPGAGASAAFRPGQPPLEVVVADEAGLRRIRRDPAAEREREERLLERCPILSSLPFEGDDRNREELEGLSRASAGTEGGRALWSIGQKGSRSACPSPAARTRCGCA